MPKPKRRPSRWVPSAENSLQLKITLKYIRPPIWRRVVVPDNLTLGDLHGVIQLAMGWTNSHLHAFRIGKTVYGMNSPDAGFGPTDIDEESILLRQVIRSKGQRFTYEYDFGDGWQHEILMEKVEPATDPHPPAKCLAGKRACPPEDCGGPPGYALILRVLRKPTTSEDIEFREWVGDYDPEDFDVEFVNRLLGGK